MEKEKYVINGYQFQTRAEYERAGKEKETIAYLTANTDMTDMKAVLKLYNRSVEKEAFRTIIGLEFLCNMRKKLIASKIASEDTLAPVTVPGTGRAAGAGREKQEGQGKDIYKERYENAVANQKIKNILITVLALVIIAMLIITWTSKYTVFTYFTDYKNDIRNEVIDEMEEWQQELEEREKALEDQEPDTGKDPNMDKSQGMGE